MKTKVFAKALVCAGLLLPAATSSLATEIPFEEVLERSRQSPALARAEAEVERQRAAQLRAATYPHNPELEFELADRRGEGRSTTDRGVQLSQRIEWGGQREQRRQAADATLKAAEGTLRQARASVLGAATKSFAQALYHRELLALREVEAELARQSTAITERRLEAGSATAIDLALAQASHARVERAWALAKGDYGSAQASLAEQLGAAESALLEPAGALPAIIPPPPLDELMVQALAGRGDVEAASARVEAAQARHRLAQALRRPDLTVSARSGREEGDDISGLAFSIPIPVFQRQRGEIAESSSGIQIASSELDTSRWLARREIAAAHGRLMSALEAQRATEDLGVAPLEEGLSLLERAFDAGKIGAAELLLYRRELIDGRREALAAERDVWLAGVELMIATGGVFAPWDEMEKESTP
ncbi:MAG: TolC family protein [Acidobacteriota bacterium]